MGTIVVVVGHGPSLDGIGLGQTIDAHPVVRMWNNHWQSVDDYGVRYDYGLFAPPLNGHRTKPARSWWAYDVNNVPTPYVIDQVPVKYLNHGLWTDLAVHLGGEAEGRRFKLTRGCAAVCAAMELLHPSTLILAGMDMLRNGATVSPRYSPSAQLDFDQAMAGHEHVFKAAGHAREGAHDHAAERLLVERMAKLDGIRLNWLP